MKIIFFTFSVALFFISCWQGRDKKKIYTDVLQDSTMMYHRMLNESQYDSILVDEVLDVKGDDIRVVISEDKMDHLLGKVIEANKYSFLIDTGGYGNSKIKEAGSKKAIQKCELMDNSENEFVIETYVDSSTYGSGKIFVIWYDGID